MLQDLIKTILRKQTPVIFPDFARIRPVSSAFGMDRWGDYWRLTTAAAQRLFQHVFSGGVEIESCGNVMAACAFLQGIAVEDLPYPTLIDEHDPDYQVVITVAARKGL